MAKWSGTLGFVIPTEVMPGVFEDKATEKRYKGDLVRSSRRFQAGSDDKLNDDLTISNELSIVCDKFAMENLGWMRYVIFSGCPVKWKITDVEITHPRIRLTIGGQYNGPTASS